METMVAKDYGMASLALPGICPLKMRTEVFYKALSGARTLSIDAVLPTGSLLDTMTGVSDAGQATGVHEDLAPPLKQQRVGVATRTRSQQHEKNKQAGIVTLNMFLYANQPGGMEPIATRLFNALTEKTALSEVLIWVEDGVDACLSFDSDYAYDDDDDEEEQQDDKVVYANLYKPPRKRYDKDCAPAWARALRPLTPAIHWLGDMANSLAPLQSQLTRLKFQFRCYMETVSVDAAPSVPNISSLSALTSLRELELDDLRGNADSFGPGGLTALRNLTQLTVGSFCDVPPPPRSLASVIVGAVTITGLGALASLPKLDDLRFRPQAAMPGNGLGSGIPLIVLTAADMREPDAPVFKKAAQLFVKTKQPPCIYFWQPGEEKPTKMVEAMAECICDFGSKVKIKDLYCFRIDPTMKALRRLAGMQPLLRMHFKYLSDYGIKEKERITKGINKAIEMSQRPWTSELTWLGITQTHSPLAGLSLTMAGAKLAQRKRA